MNWNTLLSLPSRVQFADQLSTNESAHTWALELWNDLNEFAPFFIFGSIFIGAIAAWYFYFPYNNYPGRRYKMRRWLIFGLCATVIVTWTTICSLYGIIDTRLNNVFSIYLRIGILCGIYSISGWFITSLIICNLPVKSNAFLFFRLKRLRK